MHYSKEDVKKALSDLGIQEGDIVFSHMALWALGMPSGELTEENIFKTIYDAIFETIGDNGLLIVPTFSYSFCRGEVFDPETTPSKNMGLFPEKLRKMKGSIRTLDPIFSVCLHGNIKKIFPTGSPIISTECFGKGSIWDLMYIKECKICNIGLDAVSTYIHYVEKMLNVPYRYDKMFSGYTIINGKRIFHTVIYFVRDLRYELDREKFNKVAKDMKKVQQAKVGKGIISLINTKDVFYVIRTILEGDPYGLAKRIS